MKLPRKPIRLPAEARPARMQDLAPVVMRLKDLETRILAIADGLEGARVVLRKIAVKVGVTA